MEGLVCFKPLNIFSLSINLSFTSLSLLSTALVKFSIFSGVSLFLSKVVIS